MDEENKNEEIKDFNEQSDLNQANNKRTNPMAKYFFVAILILVLTPLIHFSTTKILFKLIEDFPNNEDTRKDQEIVNLEDDVEDTTKEDLEESLE